jgi:flagellar biosynthesis protein FlhG
MGILEPEYTFFDFYSLQKDSLNEIVLPTPVERLRMISGACGTLGIANPKYFQKQRFVRELKKLHADSIILDLGAGSGYNTIDFFLLADEKIIVMTPEPTSVYEVFGFIKVCLIRELNRKLEGFPAALEILAKDEINKPNKIKLTIGDLLKEIEKKNKEAHEIFKATLDEFRPKLVLNMVKDSDDVKEGKAIQAAVLELLCIHLDFLGYISYDQSVKEAVRSMTPFILHAPGSQAGQDLSALIRVNLLGKRGFKEILERRRWRKHVESFGKEYPAKDLLNNAPICSVNCFYWGDCEYQDGGGPCRVRHLEPVLAESVSVL